MAIPTLYNIPEIDLYNILMSFITDNVTDIRSDRKNKRWVFDTYPTTNSNYPEIVVDINSSIIIPNSAAQYCGNQIVNGDLKKEFYFIQEEIPVKVRVLTLKDSEYSVNIGKLKDKAINLYLQSEVKDIFMFKYIDLIKNYIYDNVRLIEKVRVTSVDRVYESNSRVWASDVTVTINIKNLKVKEYEQGDLINEYTLINTVKMEE